MSKEIILGTDTEVFLINTKTGVITSAEGIIGGSKEKPLALPSLGDGFAIQEDNVMAEFNVPPTSNIEEFKDNIKKILHHINTNYTNLRALIKPSANFNIIDLMTPQAQKFGCDPDYNAYLVEQNQPPDPIMFPETRFAGGHIHICLTNHLGIDYLSYTPDNPLETINGNQLQLITNLVKFMDFFVGLPACVLDTDIQRKSIYGTPGRFRVKPYGLEYRSLSNFWIEDDYLMDLVLTNTKKAVEHALNHDTVVFDDRFFDEVKSLMLNGTNTQILDFLNHHHVNIKRNELVQ